MTAPRAVGRALAWALAAVGVLLAPCAAADEPKATLEELQARLDDASKTSRERQRAAERIAEEHFQPEPLVPWLRERLDREEDFHLRLALAYALAAQGEAHGLRVLVDSLEVMGHLGYVYLTRVSEEDFGGPDVGWNVPAWEAWLSRLDAAAWRELQRQRHLPRVPTDDDAAGLAKAVAWWDGLGYPDVGTLPFVRVVDGWVESGDERRDSWHYGFLIHEDEAASTVFATDLTTRVHPRKAPEGREVDVRRTEIADDVSLELDERSENGSKDALGFGYLPNRRIKGFVLARALAARGHGDLALRVWKHVVKTPDDFFGHGPWSGLELVRDSARAASRLAWEEAAREPGRTWPDLLAEFRLHRRRFDADGSDVPFERVLERTAEESPRYAEAAASRASDPSHRARDLVLALPEVRRALAYSSWDPRNLTSYDEDGRTQDPLQGLISLGTAAVPALRAALADLRPTRSSASFVGYSKGWQRHFTRAVSVRELALLGLHEVTQRDFTGPAAEREATWEEIAERVDAWWATFQAQGERAVLVEGVLARDRRSPGLARTLVARHPEAALDAIRRAADGATPEVIAGLLDALAPLARPDVQEFLLGRLGPGPLGPRMAAARSLHAQGRPEGVDRLLEEWPALAAPPEGLFSTFGSERELGDLVALLLDLEPLRSLRRFESALGDLDARAKFVVLAGVHRALAGGSAAPEVPEAAEALVVAMVLDAGEREGQYFGNEGRETNSVGERAAVTAASLWPDRYEWDGDGPSRARRLQRHAIVNAWRTRTGRPLLDAPRLPQVAPLPPATTEPLIAAWLSAEDETARSRAAEALLSAGLGALPALREARDALSAADTRRRPLDLLVRRSAVILREVAFAPGSLPPGKAFEALATGAVGKPVTGTWITGLWRALASGAVEGATGLDLRLGRPGDDTGAVVVLELSSATTPWERTHEGWILAGDGWEHVDDDFVKAATSWWHESRSGQLDEDLDVPEDAEIRLRRAFTRVR